jgi:hypothetical protein
MFGQADVLVVIGFEDETLALLKLINLLNEQ